MLTVSRRADQFNLTSQQYIVVTVEDSVLRTEMDDLESQEKTQTYHLQEEDTPKRILFFKPMSWLDQIRPHRRDQTWSPNLVQTFFSTSMDTQIPVITEKSLESCGSRKFQIDPLGDHLITCTVQSCVKKTHDWVVDQLTDLFHTTHKVKTQQVIKTGVSSVGTLS